MTKRTRAANAAALSIDTPDRRTMLAVAGAAAVLAAIGAPTAAEALDPDAALLALRPAWLAACQAHTKACNATDAAFNKLQARGLEAGSAEHKRASRDEGLPALQRVQSAACNRECAAEDAIAAMPARTLAGVGFKAEVSRRADHMSPDLVASIMADIQALAGG